MTKRKWFIHGQTHSTKTSGVSLHILCSCLKHVETNIQPWSVCSLKSAASDSHDLHCIVCEPAFYQCAAQQLISQLQGIWGFHHLQNIIAAPLYEAIDQQHPEKWHELIWETERRSVHISNSYWRYWMRKRRRILQIVTNLCQRPDHEVTCTPERQIEDFEKRRHASQRRPCCAASLFVHRDANSTFKTSTINVVSLFKGKLM